MLFKLIDFREQSVFEQRVSQELELRDWQYVGVDNCIKNPYFDIKNINPLANCLLYNHLHVFFPTCFRMLCYTVRPHNVIFQHHQLSLYLFLDCTNDSIYLIGNGYNDIYPQELIDNLNDAQRILPNRDANGIYINWLRAIDFNPNLQNLFIAPEKISYSASAPVNLQGMFLVDAKQNQELFTSQPKTLGRILLDLESEPKEWLLFSPREINPEVEASRILKMSKSKAILAIHHLKVKEGGQVLQEMLNVGEIKRVAALLLEAFERDNKEYIAKMIAAYLPLKLQISLALLITPPKAALLLIQMTPKQGAQFLIQLVKMNKQNVAIEIANSTYPYERKELLESQINAMDVENKKVFKNFI